MQDAPNYHAEDLPEDSEFFMWVGRCIKRWAEVETHLFEICDWTMNTHRSIATIVYFKTPSLDARMTLVDELIKRTIDPKNGDTNATEILRRWDRFFKDSNKLKTIRNSIAHQPVAIDYETLFKSAQLSNPTDEKGSLRDKARVIRQRYVEQQRKPATVKTVDLLGLKKHHESVTKLAVSGFHLHQRLLYHAKPLQRDE